MDILILNTHPARSSLFRDNGTGNTLVPSEKGRRVPELCNRRPEILACFSHVSRMFLACRSRVSRVLLAFCSRAPAFCRLKAHGIPFAAQCGATFLPFYSAEIGCLSEKRSQVARPQRETRISIENGNAVARPPCQTFHSRISIVKGNAVARPPCNNFRTALYQKSNIMSYRIQNKWHTHLWMLQEIYIHHRHILTYAAQWPCAISRLDALLLFGCSPGWPKTLEKNITIPCIMK